MAFSAKENVSAQFCVQSTRILGLRIDAVDISRAVDVIAAWVANGEQRYVCAAPAHSIMDCYRRPYLYRLFNASGMTVPDGMAVAWLVRWRGYKDVSRVAGSDLLDAIMQQSLAQGWKHYFYGGAPGIPEKLSARLEEKYPGVKMVGSYSPPFRPLTEEEDREIVAEINAAAPDILWVGIGSPKQERWMAGHMDKVKGAVMIGVGAAFDFLSGQKKRAPLWMQRLGLEWLYRFISEPKRLWPRYSQYPLFVLLAFVEAMGIQVDGRRSPQKTS